MIFLYPCGRTRHGGRFDGENILWVHPDDVRRMHHTTAFAGGDAVRHMLIFAHQQQQQSNVLDLHRFRQGSAVAFILLQRSGPDACVEETDRGGGGAKVYLWQHLRLDVGALEARKQDVSAEEKGLFGCATRVPCVPSQIGELVCNRCRDRKNTGLVAGVQTS